MTFDDIKKRYKRNPTCWMFNIVGYSLFGSGKTPGDFAFGVHANAHRTRVQMLSIIFSRAVGIRNIIMTLSFEYRSDFPFISCVFESQ